jgi:uncharacterized protein YgiM (DUF1202 family)
MASAVIGQAPKGTEIYVAKETKHWLLVRVDGVGEGWLLSHATNIDRSHKKQRKLSEIQPIA